MSKYRDLSEFYDPDLLLPIAGNTYRIRCPGIAEADRLRDIIFRPNLTAEQEYAEIVKVLGAARDDMIRDGVPDTMALHAGRTALLHFGGTPDLALANWKLGQLGDLVDIHAIAAKLADSPEAPPGR